MTNEDKILQALSQLTVEVGSLRTEIANVHTEVADLRAEMTDLRTEVTDLRTEVTDLREEMNERFDRVDEEFKSTHLATGDIVNKVGELLDDKLVKFAHELKWTKDATAQNSLDIAALKNRC